MYYFTVLYDAYAVSLTTLSFLLRSVTKGVTGGFTPLENFSRPGKICWT